MQQSHLLRRALSDFFTSNSNKKRFAKRIAVFQKCRVERFRRLLLENLEACHVLTDGFWLAVFQGLPAGSDLHEQTAEGKNLIQASGLLEQDVRVVKAPQRLK